MATTQRRFPVRIGPAWRVLALAAVAVLSAAAVDDGAGMKVAAQEGAEFDYVNALALQAGARSINDVFDSSHR